MKAVFKNSFVTCPVTIAAFFAATLSPVSAQTFPARTTVNLCPDYRLGGVQLEFGFRIGPSSYTPVQIASINVDSNSNTATVDLNLPNGFGPHELSVAAFCRNQHGLSRDSNNLRISNCHSLARRDSDGDGIDDATEDTNCSNSYEPGVDLSDSRAQDTDGDGTYDLESAMGISPSDPYKTPHPRIVSSQPFDLDGDGQSDAVTWTPSSGMWRTLLSSNSQLSEFGFGQSGDIPFTYANSSIGLTGGVGVVRNVSGSFTWYFSGPGFRLLDGTFVNEINGFGRPGDYLIPGPWETPGQTSPAIARPEGGTLNFYRYGRNGMMVYIGSLGITSDLPIPGDFNGTGLFTPAIYRPSQNVVFIFGQSPHALDNGVFQGGIFVAGDSSGDGRADISFFNPGNRFFSSLTSDFGLNAAQGNQQVAPYYNGMFLAAPAGNFIPLNHFRRGGKILHTIVDHATGKRLFHPNNNAVNPATEIILGAPGDWQG